MPDRPAVRRVWFPILVVVLAGLAVAGLWYWPNPEFPNDLRGFFSTLSVLVAILLLGVWVLFLSGMRWLLRIGIIAVVIGLVVLARPIPEFQGNLIPVDFHFRWERPRAEVRAAERARQGKAAEIPIPAASAEDFPEYRNRNRDGVITGPKLARDWQAQPPRKLWQETVGGGYAGVAVVGPVAVTIEQVGGDEAVVCYDADTGKERWNYSYKGLFSEAMGGDGPRATPTIADGDVYSLGATGKLVRLDGATGKPKWEVDILAGNGNIQWGMSGSPLVYDRYVVVNPGAQTDAAKGKAVVAYDRETGHVLWATGDRKAGYSSPELATLGGVRQVLVLDADAIAAFDPATGKELWSHEWKTNPEVNVAQPLMLDGDRVFVSSGYGHGCVLLKVTQSGGQWSAEPVWQNTNLKCKFTSPVYRDGYIYGIDESAGSLVCLDAKDGKRKWKEGRYGNGQILLAGDLIVIGTENGRLALVEANPAAFHELASVPVLPGNKNWNHLTLARGRAYVRNHEVMACYELPTEK